MSWQSPGLAAILLALEGDAVLIAPDESTDNVIQATAGTVQPLTIIEADGGDTGNKGLLIQDYFLRTAAQLYVNGSNNGVFALSERSSTKIYMTALTNGDCYFDTGATGHVGFGERTPATRIHATVDDESHYPAVRLENLSTSGYGASIEYYDNFGTPAVRAMITGTASSTGGEWWVETQGLGGGALSRGLTVTNQQQVYVGPGTDGELYGGNASGSDLTLGSTTNPTKGSVFLGDATDGLEWDEANNDLYFRDSGADTFKVTGSTGVISTPSAAGRIDLGGVASGGARLNCFGSGESGIAVFQGNNMPNGGNIFQIAQGGTAPASVIGFLANLVGTTEALAVLANSGAGDVYYQARADSTGDAFIATGKNAGNGWSFGYSQGNSDEFRIAKNFQSGNPLDTAVMSIDYTTGVASMHGVTPIADQNTLIGDGIDPSGWTGGTAVDNTLVGYGAALIDGLRSMASVFGSGAQAATRGSAFGYQADARASGCAFGVGADALGNFSIAVGRDSYVNYTDSQVYGYLATATKANQIMFGSGSSPIDETNWETTSGTLDLAIDGSIIATLDAGGSSNGPACTLLGTRTITGTLADGYAGGIELQPTYDAASAQTVTRHNYITLDSGTIDTDADITLTDACAITFDAAAGTHPAVDGSSTKSSPGTVDAWMKININGTIYYMPAYTSKTS